MEVIIDAKERQAAEANKNATILLQEIDLEKVSSFIYMYMYMYLAVCCVVVEVYNVQCRCVYSAVMEISFLTET